MINLLILLTDAQPSGIGKYSMPIMFLLIFVVMYLFMIRPQQKKQKAIAKFRENLKKGDKVVTIGGIHGRINQVESDHIFLEIDKEVKIKVEKSAVSQETTDRLNETK